MSILDFLDDPTSLGRLFGVADANGMAAPPVLPGPSFDQRFQPAAGLPPASSVMLPATAPVPPPAPGNPGENEALAWGNPGGQTPNVPLPRPRPAGFDAMAQAAAEPPYPSGELAMNPTTRPLAATGVPVAPPGPAMTSPMAAAPGMPPGGGAAAAPEIAGGGGFLSQAFGLSPQQRTNLRSMFAGLGHGLSAVGGLRPGASGAQAFAAGAGGALTGTTADQEKQQQLLFNNSSTAFKDLLAANESGDRHAINRARTNYYDAITQSIQSGRGRYGTSGSNAWQNTPYGRMLQVEKLANDYQTRQQQILQRRWQLNGTDPAQQEKELHDLQTRVDQFRQRLYKGAGISQTDAQKLQNMGLTADNPFDTTGMTVEQFHAQVPMGAWYKANGKVYQRTVPPPGSGDTHPNSAAGSAAFSVPERDLLQDAA